MLKKMKSKRGFTLVEMLIVVAIIAVLVVVAIPIYNAQLEKARERVDLANARSASSMAVADYLLEGSTGAVTYWFSVGADNEIYIAGTGTDAPEGATLIDQESDDGTGDCTTPLGDLTVTVDYTANTNQVDNTWLTAFNTPPATPGP